MIRFMALVLAIVVAASVGCSLNADDGTGTNNGATGTGGSVGSGGSSGTSSGLARNLALATLTDEQASVLCDWTNAKQGGYGRIVACTDGAQSTNPSNLSCVQSTRALGATCSRLTVGSIEDCANVTGSDLCKLASAAECIAVTTCGQ